jgi:hypothetical protein
MRSADQGAWATLAAEVSLVEPNHAAASACRGAAQRTKKEQRCVIVVPTRVNHDWYFIGIICGSEINVGYSGIEIICREHGRKWEYVFMIEREWATEFARHWIESWNSHDLDRILSHYNDDFEMSSPLIIERKQSPGGVLRGKAAIREYWAIGLGAVPPLQFELIDVHVGINAIAILYRSIGRRRVIEMLTLNEERKVIRGAGLYGGAA